MQIPIPAPHGQVTTRRSGALFGRLLASLALAMGLANPAGATWSIVAVDTATGEVCIASATCLLGLSLRDKLPVVRVGIGAGAAQSFIDLTGANRLVIWEGLADGKSPADILLELVAGDAQHQTRQYGIVNMADAPAAFTGTGAGAAKAKVTGISGTLRYAIQGNVLTGPAVVIQAEAALLQSTGDLSQRVMAAMEKARSLGGDGRCSCHPQQPSSCGAPPGHFATSALIGFVIVARMGDVDGVCDAAQGCANGAYYLNLDVAPGKVGTDVVKELQSRYVAWRAGLSGRPDHIRSLVTASAASLPADGQTTARVDVELVDLDGVPLTTGGALLSVETVDGSPLATSVGPITDHGDGSYSFEITAGATTGVERLRIVADDGVARATLYPYLEVRLDPPQPLHAGFDTASASRVVAVPFTIDAGPDAAGEPYVLFASAAGTVPGQELHGLHLPLNADAVFQYTLAHAGPPNLPGSAGFLDEHGRAFAKLQARPDVLESLAGVHLDWVAAVPTLARVTNTVGVLIEP